MRLSRRIRLWRVLSSLSDTSACRLLLRAENGSKGAAPVPLRAEQPKCIFDLGANVGYTAAHFASLYPSARVIAVEMDAQNADLAARNTSAWADRVSVLHAAVWSGDGYATYGGDIEDGYAVSIMDEFGADRVDYLKMDIEGAESEVLLATSPDWLRRVDSIKIEIHNGDDMAKYISAMESAGFQCWKDDRHWSCIAAARNGKW